MKYLSPLDWTVIGVYLLGIIALGLRFRRDQHSVRDYFLGSRNIPWWGIGLSIVAAETSALTIIGVPALAFGGDLSFIQIILGYVIARVLLALFLVPRYFQGEIYSPYQLLADRFGQPARLAAAGCFLLSETMAAGVRVYVVSIPIQLLLGIDVLPAAALFILLSLVYTYAGGVKAVIWTDAVQFGLFLAGGLFTLFYIPTLIHGGWPQALHLAAEGGKLHWLNPRFSFAAPFNLWMGLLGGTVQVLSSHGAEQLIVQRVLACRTVRDGRLALLLSAVLVFPLFLVFLLVGVLLWVWYQIVPIPIPLPESHGGIKANDFVYPIFMLTAVPPVLRGGLIVAILAAAMSSVSSALTSLASVSTMDLIRPWRARQSDAAVLRFSKASTFAWALLLLAVAWLSRDVAFVFNAAFSLRGLTSGALLGGVLLAAFGRPARPAPIVLGMATAVATLTAIQLLPRWSLTAALWERYLGPEIFWPWYTLLGTVVCLATTAALRRPTRPRP